MCRIVWKVIDEHPNYETNRMGQVRSRKSGQILKPWSDGKGYLKVTLDGQMLRLHRLVAETFIENPEPGIRNIVNHKKGKKTDCRASQLAWVTQSENIQHAWDTGLCKRKKVCHGY